MKKEQPQIVDPPLHLSERSQKLWTELTATEVETSVRRALLLTGLEALDRSEQARLAIATEGLTSTTESTGAVHLHPLVRVERESKQLFSKIMGQLGLALKTNPW